MFEKATRLKLRFKVANGLISVEDLWDLNLNTLDVLARGINKELQESEVSFIGKRSDKEDKMKLQFDVVKRVIDVKLEEREQAKELRDRVQRKQQLLNVLADKQEESLRNMSKEDILKELESLG